MLQNVQLLDGTMEKRLYKMEAGITELDEKVSLIDRKVDHLGNVQMEMFDEQNRMGENLSAELRHQKEQLSKWQGEMKKQIYSRGRWYYYGLGFILFTWFVLMLNWILSH